MPRILRQEIVDYRTKLVEEEWTPAKRKVRRGNKEKYMLVVWKRIPTFATGERENSVVISAGEIIICYILQNQEKVQGVRIGEKVFKMVNSKRKFCSHECYIKNRFWSKEDATELIDALWLEKIL